MASDLLAENLRAMVGVWHDVLTARTPDPTDQLASMSRSSAIGAAVILRILSQQFQQPGHVLG